MAENRIEMISQIDKVYAAALLELCDEAEGAGRSGLVDEVADELRQIGELVRREPALIRLLSVRTLLTRERSEIIERLFKGRVADLLYRFLQVVNAKDRLDHLEEIVSAFAVLLEERRGVIDVDAYLASRMDEPAVLRVAESLGTVLGGRVDLTQHEDPELIGGLKLRVGDRLIDGSVATQLRLLREKMVEAGREKARGI